MPEDEKQYKDLNTLKNRIKSDEKSLKELKGKKIMVLFGTTGTGKSTLANGIIQGPEKLIKKDGLFYTLEPLRHKGEIIFKIGH